MTKRFGFILACLGALLCLDGCTGVRDPDIHLSFDGTDPMQWANRGVRATGETPFRIGDAEAPRFGTSPGISGQAFDGRALASKQPAAVPVWGTDRVGLPDSELESIFDGAHSFTVACWIKTEEFQPQGRLLKTSAFQINYRGDRLETGFAKPKKWYASQVSEERFGSVGQWRFVAVTWQSDGMVRYYSGTKDTPVVPAGSAKTDWPVLAGSESGCWLVVGNSEAEGNRPFVGVIDELRIWVSKEAVPLTMDEVERIRKSL